MLREKDAYEAVYVVSDLHLGGYVGEYPASERAGGAGSSTRDYHTFFEADAMQWLVGEIIRLAKEQHQGRVALVLNGDVVDFLALERASYFSIDNALRNLQTIVADPAQHGAWQAFSAFVAAGVGDLVIVLGNHDVELALPQVRHFLVERLTEGVPARRANVVCAMDGAGFGCTVGRGRVLCVHGNEADVWNVVDHPRLVQVCRAITHDRPPPEWSVNAGTTLVIDVMNALKRRWQWVDLLKPEGEAVVMILVAIDKELMPVLKHAWTIANRAGRDAVKRSLGFLGPGDPQAATTAETTEDQRFLRALARAATSRANQSVTEADELIRGIRERLAEGNGDPLEVDGPESMLGARDAAKWICDAVQLRLAPGHLHDVLAQRLDRDVSFSPLAADDTFNTLDAAVGPAIDFLVAGHTHHEKALKREHAAGYYYNSGSWIRLMSLPEEALQKDIFEQQVLQVLEEGSMEALQRPIDLGTGKAATLLRTTRTVVCVSRTDDDGARGELLHVDQDAAGNFTLASVPGTVQEIP